MKNMMSSSVGDCFTFPKFVLDIVTSSQPKSSIRNDLNPEDKITKSTICAGVLFWVLAVGGLATCACVRGFQEYKKHTLKHSEKAKIIQIQNQR